MDYAQLSDFEINKRVAEIVYSIDVVADDPFAEDVPFAYHKDERVFIFIDEPLSVAWRSYNPCNNPADAWPIIHENRISINFDNDGYDTPKSSWCRATAMNGDEYYGDEKRPLRAAMIVFLRMQD